MSDTPYLMSVRYPQICVLCLLGACAGRRAHGRSLSGGDESYQTDKNDTDRSPDDVDRGIGPSDDGLGDASQEEAFQTGETSAPHHHLVDVVVIGS